MSDEWIPVLDAKDEPIDGSALGELLSTVALEMPDDASVNWSKLAEEHYGAESWVLSKFGIEGTTWLEYFFEECPSDWFVYREDCWLASAARVAEIEAHLKSLQRALSEHSVTGDDLWVRDLTGCVSYEPETPVAVVIEQIEALLDPLGHLSNTIVPVLQRWAKGTIIDGFNFTKVEPYGEEICEELVRILSPAHEVAQVYQEVPGHWGEGEEVRLFGPLTLNALFKPLVVELDRAIRADTAEQASSSLLESLRQRGETT
jgi:hypothetical protein